MATQVNTGPGALKGDGVQIVWLDVTLITSGTTVTYTFPANMRVLAVLFMNVTTGAINPVGGTYVKSTGVWTSPTMAVNDNAIAVFICN